MVNARHYPKIASLLLLSAQPAVADVLFTNFVGDPFEDKAWVAGGACASGSCYAIKDNFSSDGPWHVTGFTFHLLSQIDEENLANGGRFALFTAADAQVVAPTDTALTVTDTGLTSDDGNYKIFRFEISGLDINLDPGEYWFAFTHTIWQQVWSVSGSPSSQTISPGIVLLFGSAGVEALLSTTESQKNEVWAFQVIGTDDTTFADGFETP